MSVRRNQRVASRRRRASKVSWQERAEQLRSRARALAPNLAIAAVAIGLPAVIYQGYMYAITSPSFAVSSVEISGAEFVSHDVVIENAGIVPGINIFDVDEIASGEHIEALAWVDQAKVTSSLPGTVKIDVIEHVPAAVVIDGADFVLVDADAAPFKTLDAKDPLDKLLTSLPLLSGASRDELAAEDPRARERMLQGLEVLSVWSQLGLDRRASVSQVHIDKYLGVTLTVGARGTEVRLGWGRWRERLERYAIVQKKLDERGVAVEYVLVDQQDDIDRVAVGPAKTKDR